MTPVDLSALDSNNDGKVTLAEVECQQIHITTLDKPLPACGEEYLIRIGFVLHDVPEIFYNLDYFDETNPNELIFDHWPTNCYQGDTVSFDILFALLQTDYTPPGGGS